MDTIEIQPATIDQLARAKNGKLVVIDSDVGNVASDLQAIDPQFRLRYSPEADISIVYHDDGVRERLVTTMQGTPDQRLVNRVREIASPQYDLAGELERHDARVNKQADERFHEKIGDASERLAHAIRTDLHDQSRVSFYRGR